jgi:hypothetical protein
MTVGTGRFFNFDNSCGFMIFCETFLTTFFIWQLKQQKGLLCDVERQRQCSYGDHGKKRNKELADPGRSGVDSFILK